MSAHKKFDDYIRGLFEKDPQVPAELGWESMNFDLPEPPKPEKEDKKKYLLLLFLLLIGLPLLYLGITNIVINDTQLIESVEQTTDFDSEENLKEQISTSLNLDNSQNLKKENTLTNILNIPSPKLNNEKLIIKNSTQTELVNFASSTSNRKIKSLGTQTSLSDENSELNLTSTTSPKTTFPIQFNDKNDLESNDMIINPLSPRVIQSLDLNSIVNEGRKQLDLLVEKDTNEDAKKAKTEVLLAYGYGQYNLNFDDSNILEDKVKNILSKSIRAAVRFNLKNNWKANVGLKFDKYHSTFEYTRNLETVIDTANLKRIYRDELTFHNNFTSSLGLQLGLEKQFKITSRLSVSTGMNFTPTYISSASGKSISQDTTIPNFYDNQINSIALSGGISGGVIFAMNRFVNLEMNYQFNNFFGNGVFINNGVYSNQQNILSAVVSYKFY